MGAFISNFQNQCKYGFAITNYGLFFPDPFAFFKKALVRVDEGGIFVYSILAGATQYNYCIKLNMAMRTSSSVVTVIVSHRHNARGAQQMYCQITTSAKIFSCRYDLNCAVSLTVLLL